MPRQTLVRLVEITSFQVSSSIASTTPPIARAGVVDEDVDPPEGGDRGLGGGSASASARTSVGRSGRPRSRRDRRLGPPPAARRSRRSAPAPRHAPASAPSPRRCPCPRRSPARPCRRVQPIPPPRLAGPVSGRRSPVQPSAPTPAPTPAPARAPTRSAISSAVVDQLQTKRAPSGSASGPSRLWPPGQR